jgi:crossover junction endodeoxyribonuclease RuvC
MPRKPRTILGIDPGFGRVGWGVIHQDGRLFTHIDHGVIETSPKLPFSQRLSTIYISICALAHKYKPKLAGIEQLFFSQNVTSAMHVSEARGVILLALQHAGVPIAECTPQAVKQALVGYGRADKTQMQRMVKILLKLKTIPTPDDAADAIAIAMTVAFEIPL